jgi:hypothetical protein
MLISKTVKVKWNPANKKHYESKGYLWTKAGDEFEAKIEDLSKGANVYVEIICDNCNETKSWIWTDYIKQVKSDNKCYCNKCSIKINGTKTLRLTNLEKSKSLHEWCVENNRQDILGLWDYELNNITPSEVTYGSNAKYYFKCPRGIHKSELKKIKSIGNRKILCDLCNSFAQFLIDLYGKDALELYWDYHRNKVNPWNITACDGEKKVWIKCQEKDYHGSYETVTSSFNKGDRCSYCSSHKIHVLDSLGTQYPKTIELWSSKNEKSPYEYSCGTQQEVWWKCDCDKHENYCRSVLGSKRYDFRCPECVRERDESFLQEKVRLYLNELGYALLHEHKCNIISKNPKSKTNGSMPYDNEVVELRLICEIHGEQHYKEISGKWFNSDFDFHKRKLYDRYKRIFAKSQGYEYLEIPYWTDDKDETWKKLIDEKIKEILIKTTA